LIYRTFLRHQNDPGETQVKVAVMETPKGTVVTYIKPSHLLGRYEGVQDIGSELDAVVAKVVASVQH